MNGAVAIGVVWLLAVALAGVALTVSAHRLVLPTWMVQPRERVTAAIYGSVEAVGRVATAIFVAAAGLMLLIVALWILGVVAHHTQNHIDWPAFRWFQRRQAGGSWQHAWNQLTQMGNRRQTQALTVLGAISFAAIWKVRRGPGWLTPLIGMPIAYLMEKYGGTILGKVVNRGHPPTTLGTWPSGGCARLILVYGLIALMALRLYSVGRRGRVATFSVVGFLAAVEAYSRTYLLKHWITDVIGGVLFGLGLLLVVSLALRVFEPTSGEPSPDARDAAAAAHSVVGRSAQRVPTARH